jgi:thiamine-monophosphate kinase
LTSAGLKHLLEGVDLPETLRDEILSSIYMPEARVKEGLSLAATGKITGSIDSSDGLSVSLYDLMRSTGYGFILDTIPVHETVEKFAVYNDLDPNELALFGGEEYELVFTYDPLDEKDVLDALNIVGCSPTIIGKVSEVKEIVYELEGKQIPILKGGWDHFTS